MNIFQYSQEIKRTCPDLGSDLNNQLHMAIGASTEANELLDSYKKWFAYGKELDKVNVAEEISDCFWYLVNLCNMLNLNPQEVFDINIKKLKARYPEKFTQYNANNRNLEEERKILEELGFSDT
jgi:NTP pyrophosphatase (non-canonical NTP hydrolase)